MSNIIFDTTTKILNEKKQQKENISTLNEKNMRNTIDINVLNSKFDEVNINIFENKNKISIIDEKFFSFEKTFTDFNIETGKNFERVEQRFENLENKIDKRFERVEQRFENLENKIDKRFGKVEQRFEIIENKIDKRFESVDKKVNKIYDYLITKK